MHRFSPSHRQSSNTRLHYMLPTSHASSTCLPHPVQNQHMLQPRSLSFPTDNLAICPHRFMQQLLPAHSTYQLPRFSTQGIPGQHNIHYTETLLQQTCLLHCCHAQTTRTASAKTRSSQHVCYHSPLATRIHQLSGTHIKQTCTKPLHGKATRPFPHQQTFPQLGHVPAPAQLSRLHRFSTALRVPCFSIVKPRMRGKLRDMVRNFGLILGCITKPRTRYVPLPCAQVLN